LFYTTVFADAEREIEKDKAKADGQQVKIAGQGAHRFVVKTETHEMAARGWWGMLVG